MIVSIAVNTVLDKMLLMWKGLKAGWTFWALDVQTLLLDALVPEGVRICGRPTAIVPTMESELDELEWLFTVQYALRTLSCWWLDHFMIMPGEPCWTWVAYSQLFTHTTGIWMSVHTDDTVNEALPSIVINTSWTDESGRKLTSAESL